MKHLRIAFTSLLLTLSVWISPACKKAELPESSGPENKSQDSLAACEDLNLARDAAWTPYFLRTFISCASIQNDQRRGTLDQSLRLIDALGPERLQAAMDLMLSHPEAQSYPNLSAMITAMDGAAGTSASMFRPRPVLQLLMDLEEREALDGLVQDLMNWSDALPPGSVAGVEHRLLTEPQVRADILQLQKTSIDDPLTYERLKKLWQPRSYSLIADARDFWDKATVIQQKSWAHIASAFLRMGLETQIDELLRRTHDIYDLGRSYALRQTWFLQDMRELIDQGLATRLSDLDPAMKGLSQIKDNLSYRDAFEEKAGSTYLHELVEDFIWEGAPLQSCSAAFPGMKTQSGLDNPRAIMEPLLTPQAACQGRIPLLLYLDETLGLNCRTGVCARRWMAPESAVDAADLQKLGRFAWHWLEKELSADPYRLKNRQLAYAAIDEKNRQELKAWWQNHLPRSAAELVRFDQELTADPRFESLLKKDFLESWYGLMLQKLNTLPDEFRDLWPDSNNREGWYQKAVDFKLQRAGLGLYAFGALDQSFARSLPLSQSFSQMNTALPGAIDAANFSQILSPTRELASQIKNANVSIKPETEKITYELPGSIAAHLSYGVDGRIVQTVQPLARERLVREAADSWGFSTRFRDQLPLLTAAADPLRAKALESWIADAYLPAFTDAAQNDLGHPLESLPFELFESEALTPEDVRLFTLYAAQSWLAVQPRLPAGTQINPIPATPAFTREGAPQAFLGVPLLAGSSQTWTGFWVFDSGIFGSPSSLQGLLQALPQDAAAVKQDFLQAAQNPQILTQGRLNVIDREKLSKGQKIMLQLQAVSSLYKSRGQQQILPALGFDAFCPTAAGVGNCPFTLTSFASFHRFMEERVLDNFCPFVSGQQFSAAFQQRWQKALGFSDSPEQLKALCAGIPAAPAGTMANAVWEHNWLTLLQLGRNPQLKASMQQLPETIRRLKIQSVSGDYQKFVRWNELAPLWMPIANARLQHREGVYAAFRWHAPGMIDHVMAAYSQEIGDKSFTDAVKKLARQSSDGVNPIYDLIDTVTSSYAQSVTAQETPTLFLLRLADRISQDPRLIQTTSRLLEKPEDPYAGILLAYTFPQAMKVGVFEDFAWDHPSYKLMRLAFKSENRRLLLGLVAAFDRLSPKLWKIYQDAASGFADRDAMARDVDQLLHFAADALRRGDGDGTLSLLWQDLVRPSPSEASMTSLIRLAHQMREPLVDLSNTWQAPLMQNLDAVLHSSLTALLHIVPKLDDFDQLIKAWRGLSAGLLHTDGTALWSLLQDKRLGLGTGGIIPMQLRDPSMRAELRAVFRSLWILEADWVLAALDEWESLAVSTQKVLHYFQKNVKWSGPGSASYQYFIQTLDQQLEDDQKQLKKTLDLMRVWLRPETCAEGERTC